MQENKMGTMSIGKLLVEMSIPLMISMFVQALYNLVDSVFVARLNENAFTAVSLAFPIQMIMIAIGVGTAIGVNALTARYLGAKDRETASKTAKNGLFLAFMSWIFMIVLLLIILEPFFRVQTNDAQIYQYAVDYTRIVGFISIGIFQQIMMERLLQATGKTVLSMISQLVGAVINIILDPILIFGLLGMPRLEVKGAALATIIGQLCGMVVGIVLNFKCNKELDLNLKGFRPSGDIIKQIYQIGFPSIVMQSIGSFMAFGFNKILMGFTSTAVAVFGAYVKLNGFVFMPVFALNSSLIPIISYNFGAGNADRIRKTNKIGIITAMAILGFGCVIFEFFPHVLLSMFHPTEEFLTIGTKAFKVIGLCFIPAGYSIALGALFQATGRAVYSMINSICRQLVILLPVAFLLSKVGGLHTVWWAFPIAEIGSLLLSIYYYGKIKREVLDKLDEQQC